MTPTSYRPANHPASFRALLPGRRWTLYSTLLCVLAGFAAALPAAETSVSVEDAEVVANEPGIFPLPFVITRTGDLTDGVRILVETAVGGSNPGVPGEDYTPLPPGTEVLLSPDETATTVEVDVIGDPVPGPDETLLLHLTGAQAFSPDPRLTPTAMHFRVCCLSRAMKLADLNGDGDLDIVTGNDLSFDFSVLLSDGEGGFADAVTYPVGGAVLLGRIVVAVGDVTGDGIPDVVATGFNPDNIEVFAGDGVGGLDAPIFVPLGAGNSPTSVAVSDVNDDGNLDIVTANGNDHQISVLIGDGAGGFGAAVSFSTGSFPNSVAVADVTGDGLLDVITSNGSSDDVSVLVGDGAGAFSPPQHLSVGPEARPLSVVVADVTADGNVDLVTANQFDDGGFPPVDTPGSVSVLAGDGTGGFADAVQHSVGEGKGRAQSVAVADVTGDGHPDIAVARPINNTATLLIADGIGGFDEALDIPTGDGPNPIGIGDVTADGNLDVVIANAVGESVSVLPGDGEGNIGFPGHFDAGEFPHSVATADLNGDGFQDVVTANLQSNDASVLINDGDGGFADTVSFEVGSSPSWITTGDLNGDEIPDLITANLGGGSVSVLLGDGTGGFADAVSYSIGEGFQSPYAVAVADVNNDGHLDIGTANTNISNSSISILLGDGAGGFGAPVLIPGAAQQPQSIALADVTGDGNADVLVPSFGSAEVALLAGDGTGDFGDPVFLATDIGPVFVIVADVTADGNPDVITLNHTGQSVSVLAGDGSGGFDAAVHFEIFDVEGVPCTTDPNAGCPWPWGLAVSDVTGDGALDIVTANTNNSTVSVLPNTGSGSFPTFAYFDSGAQPGAAAVADVTGDGNLDVITANRQNNNISVLANELSGVELLNDEAVGTIIRDSGSGEVLLAARGRRVQGEHTVDLTWEGAASDEIDVFRDGEEIATVPNDGEHTDSTGRRGRATYIYQVCEAGTSVCSNEVTVRFGGRR